MNKITLELDVETVAHLVGLAASDQAMDPANTTDPHAHRAQFIEVALNAMPADVSDRVRGIMVEIQKAESEVAELADELVNPASAMIPGKLVSMEEYRRREQRDD